MPVENEKDRSGSKANSATAGGLNKESLNKIIQKHLSASQEKSAAAKVIEDSTNIAHIAFKTNITPNNLIEIYQKSDGSGCDVKAMSQDFDDGSKAGVKNVQDKKAFFEQKKEENFESGRFAKKYPSKSAIGSFTERVLVAKESYCLSI